MMTLFKKLYQIFRCLREIVINVFFMVFIIICLAVFSLIQSDKPQNQQVANFQSGALVLNLNGYLADNHDELDDFYRLLQSEVGTTEQPAKISIFDLTRAIKRAAYDEKITGIVLDLQLFSGGDFPSIEYVGEILKEFKKVSNKPVIAIGEHYSQKQYYLASFADKIYLNKAGAVGLHGLSYSNLYFKSLLNSIEAQPHIFRVGTYKSAVEPFIRDDMSPEAKQNATLWLDGLWSNIQQKIAENRQITKENVLLPFNRYMIQFNQANGDEATFALNQQLVTELVTKPQMLSILKEMFGEDYDQDYQHINYIDYATLLPSRFYVEGNKIAVINVEGEIIWGESDNNTAGSDTLIEQLRIARNSESVKGVILRVNSPGGSALASELIRQEIEAIQQSGKPVVTSMGGMAASGGYWISATTDKIIASPNTLTGSIGIFGLAMSFEKTAKNVGVNEDGIATSLLANQSPFKTLSKEQGELIQLSIENGYNRFLDLVSRGRTMTKEQVDKIAQGQVWLGQQAVKNGLVDKLGDFETAYDELMAVINTQRAEQEKQKLENLPAVWILPQEKGLFSSLVRNFKMNIQVKLTQWLDIPFVEQIKQKTPFVPKLNDPKQSYLYCLNCGTVK
ncbi:signal peptide peptidase SppA [Phocoenobacter skyensis]|uniref:Protease-4 n=1 Tax=Phocoenobacter skyensis TaxID=97481 RepID=A0A1H7YAJ0_9PAST|nr:signal peptide peptidase SppA [Pasteurella skyensis]MDP8078776.1 signal peptide peptidase SppA [Pasteurella skyensis]MDP8085898.1 signal peptide peptidase SppA [Pasteurella skyensis]MDP8185956.1 signal peptide peptidase SppA [Pasteurella skyensis]QLB22746.1 signal peptide peptidase SppA [Pasteurella skyensis]SEM42975.1 protease-4 [Pasteurella skyensis]